MNASDEPSDPPRVGPSANGIVGSYVLIERLGAGGVGEVWKARDRVLNRVVALKFIAAPRHGSSPLGELLREARAASALNHPNIITIFEVGEREVGTYLAMEFVDGETLRSRLHRGSIPLDEVLEIASQIVSALATAHAHGIIHRDLKPENIMLRGDGYVKLVDFGLAKVLAFDQAATGEGVVATASSSGHLAGTFTYMSPEQARSRPVTAATDVFSLGIVLYEVLTGEHPFRGETVLDTLNAIVSKQPPSVHVKSPTVPRALSDIVDKTLQKEPSARYASVADLREPLKQARSLAASGLPSAAAAQSARRGFGWRYTAGAALLALVLALSIWGWTNTPSSAPPVGPIRSVAVMTFRTEANDAGAAPFAEGLPEELGSAIAATGLNVVSRGNIAGMGPAATSRTVGTQLGVDAVIEGTVRSYGGRFRIHIELVSARTPFQIWSGTFTTEGGDLLTSAQATSREIATQLRAGITGR